MTHPKFGDRVVNTAASKRNPIREGIFVRVKRIPHGRMNAGTWYECTDGDGLFWEQDPEYTIPAE